MNNYYTTFRLNLGQYKVLYDGAVTNLNTWESKQLTDDLTKYYFVSISLYQYNNDWGGITEPVSLFQGHTTSGNRLIYAHGSEQVQVYYVDKTHISLMMTINSSGFKAQIRGLILIPPKLS